MTTERAGGTGTGGPKEKGPLDVLLDLCVFTPIGLLANAREVVPDLAAKGRQQLDLQVKIARMLGRFAVQAGQQQLAKQLSPPSPPPNTSRARGSAAATGATSGTGASASEAPSIVDEEIVADKVVDADPVTAWSVGADELAIPSYDALAASQVVQRLDGLTADELEAVRRYELAHRARRTVLGKIAQLQDG